MLLELLAAALLCGDDGKKKQNHPRTRNRHTESFEEERSFYDRNSNSHSVDDDNYCDDCDDYHDDY